MRSTSEADLIIAAVLGLLVLELWYRGPILESPDQRRMHQVMPIKIENGNQILKDLTVRTFGRVALAIDKFYRFPYLLMPIPNVSRQWRGYGKTRP